MATLQSPGTRVILTDESQFAPAGPGTVPLIAIATRSNKISPNGDGVSEGTLPENAGELYLATSQRDLIQRFGEPTFVKDQGTPQVGNELNEYGLLAARQFLSISNRAYIIRSGVNLDELEPTTIQPQGQPKTGTYWLDSNDTRWGLHVSNGASVPGLAWEKADVITIVDNADTENVLLGSVGYDSNTSIVIDSSGTYELEINGNIVSWTHGGTSADDVSLQEIVDDINNKNIKNVKAGVIRLGGKSWIRLRNTATGEINLGSQSSQFILNDLGLDTSDIPITYPRHSLATSGSYAVIASENDNLGYEKLTPLGKFGQSDAEARSRWFVIGTKEWRRARPTVTIGSSNPSLPLTVNDKLIADDGSNTVTVDFDTNNNSSLQDIKTAINTEINNQPQGSQPTIEAEVINSSLVITNYEGGDLILENDTNNSGDILQSLGINEKNGHKVVFDKHTRIPSNSRAGDIWVKTTSQQNGADYSIKTFNLSTDRWEEVPISLYENDDVATSEEGLDSPSGILYAQYNVAGTSTQPVVSSLIKRYKGNQTVSIKGDTIPGQGANPETQAGDKFALVYGLANGSRDSIVITLTGNTVEDAVADINDQANNNPEIEARLTDGFLEIVNVERRTLEVTYTDPNNGNDLTQGNSGDPVSELGLFLGRVSNWEVLNYTASTTEPRTNPDEGTLWYNDDFAVDIMVGDGDKWKGYLEMYPNTDPNGPIIQASEPEEQSDGTSLVDQDIWIDTSDLENYPQIFRYNSQIETWEAIDNTDDASPFGIVFADARWTSDGTLDGSQEIEDMLNTDFVDPDAPDPRIYPSGLLLFNTRFSTYNVKEWKPNYFHDIVGQIENPGVQYSVGDKEFDVNTITDDNKARWVTISGNRFDGSPYMGRHAQRIVIVRSISEALNTNDDMFSETVFFNLLVAPGYPELISDLISVNIEKKQIATIIGDTPLRLKPRGNVIEDWANNEAGVPFTNDDGLASGDRDTYVALYYPWGTTTNFDGTNVVVPPSNIALLTYAQNDNIAFPWFAPAGVQRGTVLNASSVGYLNENGTFKTIQLNQSQRDVLYVNDINPIADLPGRGLVLFGQKTLHPESNSALKRVNVVRLTNYLRYNLDLLGRPFLFQPNDTQTRSQAEATYTRWLSNLLNLRAITDFAVQVDETNNTPARIDRNELWIDVAVTPTKAIEFIYIPVRIQSSE